ncbi:MAG: hypothetical protein R3219_08370 [Hydrogenovibrio sp.]|nr:hypothetical protein [Hydrogenovibrio sp.]
MECETKNDARSSFRVPCLFSFHHDNLILKGHDLNRNGFGLAFPVKKDGTFQFHRSEQLRNCYIQIEGQTIYFSKVRVCWLDIDRHTGGLTYGFHIESIIEPEKIKYLAVYDQMLEKYRQSPSLSISEKNALDSFQP